MQEKDFYTVIEFADKLRVHPNTVRNMIYSCRLTAIKMSNGKRSAYRIAASEIDRLAMFSIKDMVIKFFKE